MYYLWRRTIVHVLRSLAFRRLQLDRNRNMITADEQDRLGRQRIGVVGLSVGHVVAHTLAAEAWPAAWCWPTSTNWNCPI